MKDSIQEEMTQFERFLNNQAKDNRKLLNSWTNLKTKIQKLLNEIDKQNKQI
jgi:hypothetical protein